MRIFLSYRRDDAAGQAGRLHDALAARFGADAVFQDVATIRPGEDFVHAITTAVDASDVVLVVIGPRWATAAGADGQPRLDDPDDYVRLEVATALAHGGGVIPVTVAGARLPAATDLPEDLRPLTTRQAVDLRDANWGADVNAFIRTLTGESIEGRARALTQLRFVAPVVVLAIIFVALGLWRPWSGPSDAGVTELPSCAPALDSGGGWTALAISGEPTATRGVLTFEARGAGYRELAAGRWSLQVRLRMTNSDSADDVEYNSDWQYHGLVVDGLLSPLTCFTAIAGGTLIGAGLAGEALIGIEPAAEPLGQIEVDFGDGSRIVVSTAP